MVHHMFVMFSIVVSNKLAASGFISPFLSKPLRYCFKLVSVSFSVRFLFRGSTLTLCPQPTSFSCCVVLFRFSLRINPTSEVGRGSLGAQALLRV